MTATMTTPFDVAKVKTKIKPAETIDFSQIPSPCFLLDEARLKRNLEVLEYVQKESGAKIILAFKGFSMWSAFDLVRRYLPGATASSLHEALLAKHEFKGEVHTYLPAYSDAEFPKVLELSDHLVFNSFSQWERFKPQVQASSRHVSCGIRINPEYAEVETDMYNPTMPFSRLGVTRAEFRADLMDGLEGLHFHSLCEKNSDTLERTLAVIEKNYADILPKVKWVNFGGGHLMTRSDYDIPRLIKVIKAFRERWNVDVVLEPGSAVAWQTGWLVSTVLDVMHNEKDIALLDISASAHMPDTLEMPYRPNILHADYPDKKAHTYLLGGTTCLSGDVVGEYSFDKPLQVGSKVVFDDMIHYTMVKTTTFNGVKHPSIGILREDGKFELVKEFGYKDFKARLS
ncbi:MAG: carboxynorspermidine decarboxylase [Trueperaceae bacterium]